jgi:hypothetical protein
MRYDLGAVYRRCQESGLSAKCSANRVEVDLGQGAVLHFEDAEREEDCLIGFLDTPWHVHNSLIFADASGNYTELDYLELPDALTAGTILVCELWADGKAVDRYLVHNKYNDEYRYLQQGEQVIVRRAMTGLQEKCET